MPKGYDTTITIGIQVFLKPSTYCGDLNLSTSIGLREESLSASQGK
jgi:hypothetical protein